MIALIGEKEIFRFFLPFGIKVYEIESKNDILSYILEIKKNNYKILFLSNYSASLIKDELENLYNDKNDLKIIILPPTKNENSVPLYKQYLKFIVEKAVGIDLLNK